MNIPGIAKPKIHRPGRSDIALIEQSAFFDADWYTESYPDVAESGLPASEHYLWFGHTMGREPGPFFSSLDYRLMHGLGAQDINPLLHYERSRSGMSGQNARERVPPRNPMRVAVFAAYSADNGLQAHVPHYLTRLREVAQTIILVTDNPLTGADLEMAKQLSDHQITGRHGEYDFGSYKRGYRLAEQEGLMNGCHELIFCNDSCFGPIGPFQPMFEKMRPAPFDFWGITRSENIRFHLQSFFLVFRSPVFNSDAFRNFMNKIERLPTVRDVILNYEIGMTQALIAEGFLPGAVIRDPSPKFIDEEKKFYHLEHFPRLMHRKGSPLCKMKAIRKGNCNLENIPLTLDFIRRNEPALHDLLLTDSTVARHRSSESIGFSLIMPTRDRIYCIDQSIRAVLDQYHGNFELIIVDDGSTDGTAAHVKEKYVSELAEGRIKLVIHDTARGVCAARNSGLAKASRNWIAYVDSDNQIRPYFLSLFSSNIIENADKEAFYAQIVHKGSGNIVGTEFARDRLLKGNFIDLGAFVHSRRLYEQNGGFDTNLRRLVDWDLIIRYTKDAAPVFVPHVVMDYDNDEKSKSRISVRESFVKAKMAVLRKNSDKPTVTTAVLSYNQKDFIRQAIESALEQKGAFHHEILLSDDGSTDGTAEIMEEYAARFPHEIRNISSRNNVGVSENFRRCFHEACGDFIAILEGDDYWIDPSKLERQARFLIDNSNATMVFSKLRVLSESSGAIRTLNRQEQIYKVFLTGEDFIADPYMNLIANFSCCMFRTALMRAAPDTLFAYRINEIATAFYLEQIGPIGFIDAELSVYRQHGKGIWSGAAQRAQLESGLKTRQNLLNVADAKFHPRINDVIDTQYSRKLAALG